MDIAAAVVHEVGGAFKLETVQLAEPQPDEVLVRIAACGLCHTDLSIRDGLFPLPAFPQILGHEGAGVVEAIGNAVTKFSVGDHVALSFASCGSCPSCEAGRPAYCDNFFMRNFAGCRPDGSHTHFKDGAPINAVFFGQSSFASYAVAKARNVVKVPKDVPLELIGPLGCGFQTGAGTVLKHLKPAPGTSLAVFGTGAVGLAAIMAGKIARCAPIIAVDMHPSRLALALELGATHSVNAREVNSTEEVKKITGGGAQYIVEATGNPAAVAAAIESSRGLGHVALLGAGKFDAPVTVSLGALMSGATIRSVIEGDSVPDSFIPELIEFYKAGQFPIDRLIKFYDFSEIGKAVEDSSSGATVKAVLKMPKDGGGITALT